LTSLIEFYIEIQYCMYFAPVAETNTKTNFPKRNENKRTDYNRTWWCWRLFRVKLAQKYASSDAVNISFVARAQTYEIVKEKGLTLLSAEHENPVAHPHQIYRDLEDYLQQMYSSFA
jgi:hypothetical protein